jgi:predicted acyl esterase
VTTKPALTAAELRRQVLEVVEDLPRFLAAPLHRRQHRTWGATVLTEPVEVTGFVNLQVFVCSTAVDTDITAKLVDVFPEGRAINLFDGILRLRHRNDLSRPKS